MPIGEYRNTTPSMLIDHFTLMVGKIAGQNVNAMNVDQVNEDEHLVEDEAD